MQNRVLLIEDDDELRQRLARYLNNQGFSGREAANGRIAWDQNTDLMPWALGDSYRVPAA